MSSKEVVKTSRIGQVQRMEDAAVFDTRTVVQTLEGLMTRVTNEKVTSETVHAACHCADKIVDILRLHLDVKRLGLKMDPKRGGMG